MTTAQLQRYLAEVDMLTAAGKSRLLSWPAGRIVELKTRGFIARGGDGWYVTEQGKRVLTFPLDEPEKPAATRATTEKAAT